LPLHMAGLTTKALVITGPIKRQAVIELAMVGSVMSVKLYK